MDYTDIDKLVAEKVFGWELCLYGGKECWRTNKIGTAYDYIKINSTPFFSTDMIDVWVVVEILEKEEGYFGLFKWIDGGYVCQFGISENPDLKAEAETAPMAICLAALKFKGVHLDI